MSNYDLRIRYKELYIQDVKGILVITKSNDSTKNHSSYENSENSDVQTKTKQCITHGKMGYERIYFGGLYFMSLRTIRKLNLYNEKHHQNYRYNYIGI